MRESAICNKVEAEYIRKCINLATKLKENRLKAQEYLVSEFDKISKDMSLRTYDMFINKLEKPPYSIKLSAQADTLKNKRSNFLKLNTAEQAVAISEIIHLFQCNRVPANLKILGGVENAGTILMSNEISKLKLAKITNQSVTGIFENEIDLLTI